MHRTTTAVKIFLALSWLAAGLVLAEPSAESSPVPQFIAQLAEGEPKQGPLRQLGKGWAIKLGPADALEVPGEMLLSLRQVGMPLPALPEEQHLILVNGDRLPVERVTLKGERLHFVHPDLAEGQEVQITLAAVAMLWLEAGASVDDAERLRRRLLQQPRPRDRVLLSNGDSVEGTLEGLDNRKIVMQAGKKTSPIDLKQASAVVLSSELAEKPQPRGSQAQVVLIGDRRRHGSRITLNSATSDSKTLEGVTAFGVPLRVPLERVAVLDVFQGRAVYLSDLKPSKYEFVPYLDVSWPLAVNASVAGKDLRVGPSVYTRGLGMHAQGRATFVLDGKYRRFEALVGLDPKTGRQGSAHIRVLADGKPLDLGASGELSERQPTLAIRVGIEGIKELTLETGFGVRGNVQAHVNWAEARVVK